MSDEVREASEVLRDRLYKALLWLADADDGRPVIMAYGASQLADHLAAILSGECWDHRCKLKHTMEPAYCLLGRYKALKSVKRKADAGLRLVDPGEPT